MPPCLTWMFPTLLIWRLHWNRAQYIQLQPLELNREWAALNLGLFTWLTWTIQTGKGESVFANLSPIDYMNYVPRMKSNCKYSSLQYPITLKTSVWVDGMRTLKILMWICSFRPDLTVKGRYCQIFCYIFIRLEINVMVLFTRHSKFLSSPFLKEKI